MNSTKWVLGLLAGLASAGVTLACLWTSLPRKQMLPESLFHLHIHVKAEPLTIEIPTIAGQVEIQAGKKDTDLRSEFQLFIEKYERNPGEHTGFQQRNDYAAALMLTGRYADALRELVALERNFPGRYETAANLGTAYELSGKVEDALKWIKTGIERNPQSHEGTEWLHIAILEAKLHLARNSLWLYKNSVLSGQQSRPSKEIEKALVYQLNERMYFIQKRDPIMCDLFYQAALITDDVSKRDYFIQKAKFYGDIRNDEIERRFRR